MHVLASKFVHLSATEREAAIDALAALLANRREETGPMSRPESRME